MGALGAACRLGRRHSLGNATAAPSVRCQRHANPTYSSVSAPDKWRLRVRRSDDRGNVAGTATVEGDPTSVRVIAREAIKSWVLFDELRTQTQKYLRGRK